MSPIITEKAALFFLGLLYLALPLLKTPLHPGLFFIHSWRECALKAFLLFLVFWGRYRLFAPYRSKTYLVFGFFGILLMKISCYLYQSQPIEDWLSFGLDLTEFTVLSVFYGIIIEFTFRILDEVLRTEKPFNYDLTFPADRVRAGEKVLPLMGSITVFYTIFIVFGLYVLNTVYFVDWLLYTRISASLLLVAVMATLAMFEKRLEKESVHSLAILDKRLETLCKGVEFRDFPGSEREILSLVVFRKQLVRSRKIQWNWRQISLVGGCIFFLLIQAYLYQIIFR